MNGRGRRLWRRGAAAISLAQERTLWYLHHPWIHLSGSTDPPAAFSLNQGAGGRRRHGLRGAAAIARVVAHAVWAINRLKGLWAAEETLPLSFNFQGAAMIGRGRRRQGRGAPAIGLVLARASWAANHPWSHASGVIVPPDAAGASGRAASLPAPAPSPGARGSEGLRALPWCWRVLPGLQIMFGVICAAADNLPLRFGIQERA
jgi:hypothetical protein